MANQLDSYLIPLYESYKDNPVIKSLIQALNLAGIPIGPVADSFITTRVSNLKTLRLKCFFDELNTGDTQLTEKVIEQDDFLHAYFSTINYVIRTRSDEKINCFARILKKLESGKININEFEDYTAIFNELSEREFAILAIKSQYEQNYSMTQGMNPYQLTASYWDSFKNEVCLKIGLPEEELDPMLIRIQRTGCYNKFKGYLEDGPNERGDTTEIFRRIKELINQ